MNKKWIKTAEGKYSFLIDDQQIGKIIIDVASLKRSATFLIGNEKYELNLTGFWKNNFEIVDSNNKKVLTSHTEKWYANSTILDYQDKKYKLLIRNNPLAEWVITEDGNDIIAYGLHADKSNLSIRITTKPNQQDNLFDFLLWNLFVSIATENFGENYPFFMMLPG